MSDIRLTEISLDAILELVEARDPGQIAFRQSVHEVMESIIPFIRENNKYDNPGLIERIIEPERVIMFRVPWEDKDGNYRVNRGFRVQFNSALGPYKGGLRFHPTVNLSIIKFLAFEQIFKNSLTGLNLGAGKGGSDFDPKEKTESEMIRFCQSFISELYRHISSEKDIPAGDIGVGEKEIGYIYGQYKRLTSRFTGVITGKGVEYGGSTVRPQATGFGLLYFVEEMLNHHEESMENKSVVISGSGNVAQYACEKALEKGTKIIAMSDSNGFIHDKDGITKEKLDFIKELKKERHNRIKEYAEKFGCDYSEGKPWGLKCDIALPCATQNELNETDAQTLVENGVMCVAEGANMPCTDAAVKLFQKSKIIYAPGKASNAGGVAVSGMEMSQNARRLSWTYEEVDKKLLEVMKSIHQKCVQFGTNGEQINYMKGANIAGFIKVADAMIAQGYV
jgi:glutamate dehydrogenase (NADP+)